MRGNVVPNLNNFGLDINRGLPLKFQIRKKNVVLGDSHTSTFVKYLQSEIENNACIELGLLSQMLCLMELLKICKIKFVIGRLFGSR